MYSKLEHLHSLLKVLRQATKSVRFCTDGLLLTFAPSKAENEAYVSACLAFVSALNTLEDLPTFLNELAYMVEEEE